jgi:DNA modification methylase
MKTNVLPLFERHEIGGSFSDDQSVVVHLGDAGEFVRTIPNGALKLVVTSPPYNIGKQYEARTKIEDYLKQQESLIDDLIRVLHPEGSICWQVGNYVEDSEVYPLDIFFYNLFKKRGLKLRNRIIWQFGHGLHASKRFSGRYETILWFTKGEKYTFNLDNVRVPSKYPGKRHFKGPNRGQPSGNPLGKNPSDVWQMVAEDWENGVWDIPNVKANHPEKTIHPCQFPIELVERCVLALTNEGEWVFDPYCGVGSALIAALKHSRRAVGCDKESAYVATARSRIEDFYAGELKMRQLGTPVWTPTGSEKVSQIPKEWKERA